MRTSYGGQPRDRGEWERDFGAPNADWGGPSANVADDIYRDYGRYGTASPAATT
jgi:hypothetical protein